jgi:hypothetical protein
MPLDPSIIMGVQRPKSINPMEMYQAKAAIEQNELASRLGGLKLREAEQQVSDQNQLRDVYRQFGADTEANTNALFKAGLGKEASAYQQSQAQAGKAKMDMDKAQIEKALKTFEISGQIMSGVTDQVTWERARQQVAQAFGPEAAAKMPAQYDPAVVEQKRVQAMSVKDQLENMYKEKQYTTPTATAVLNAKTSTANAQLADTRARDLNAIKQDEVKLKREAKEETADLTKASQLASFDTMLGTLDRLSKHKGLSRSVGLVGMAPTMPGSDSANFQAELNTFQSQAFLPMVAQLKGMGALSDAEGKKLTAAVGALDPKMGEQAFRDSVQRITDDMQAARQRMVGAGKPAGGAPKIANKAAYDALPSGSTFTAPDGTTRRKP